MGIVRTVMMRLTTPPITKKTAAKSTKPCFTGEIAFIILSTSGTVFTQQRLSVITPGRNHASSVEILETNVKY
jgi:hypothetical protein